MTRGWSAIRRLGGATRYIVQAGDTLMRIARCHGYGMRWREIYEHPLNHDFREARQNPNRIFVGDVLYIPVDER